jgi:hypothetical protein
MESPTPNPGQGGRTDRQPGKGDDGDVGTDPRRTREKENDRDDPGQMPRKDQRQDDTPKAG